MNKVAPIFAILLLNGAYSAAPLAVGAVMAHAAPVSSSAHRPVMISTNKTTTVRIFLVAIGDNGKSGRKIGCGDSLVAVTRRVAPTAAPLSAALRLLLADHHRFYGQSGLYNALYQSRLRLQKATVVNGRATIYLVGKLQLGGVCDDPRVGAQLRRTAYQFPTMHSVVIFVNNVPLKKRLSEIGYPLAGATVPAQLIPS
jgi:hypothetical protein